MRNSPDHYSPGIGRTGIGRSLAGAFCTLAILPLLAALVGGMSQKAAQAPIDEMSSVNVRFADDYTRIIASAVALERSVHAIGLAGNPNLPETVPVQVEESLLTIRTLLNKARYPFLDSAGKHELDSLFGTITAGAQTITSHLESLLQVEKTIALKLADIESQAASVEQLTRERSAALSGNPEHVASIESLGRLRFWVSTLTKQASEATSATDGDAPSDSETRYAAGLRSAIFQLSVLPDDGDKREFAGHLQVLYELGRGDGNLFELARMQQERRAEIVRARASLSDNLRRFLAQMDALAAANNELTQASLDAANSALRLSGTALLIAGFLSVLIALVVSWRYVYKRIIERLRSLSQTTAKLSQGEFLVDITPDGDDEITDLQEALIVFQANARALDERERILAARTAELEVANQDLDNFAYVASHDLRAPLRSIDTLATFVIEDIGDQLPEESARHLKMMRNRISRLESLLVGLLEYSRIGRKDLAVENVQLDLVVTRSAELVLPDKYDLKMSGRFPCVATAAAPIEQVVRNLIDNAVKHHDKDSGTIAVDGELADGHFTLKVKDDGPGIEKQYHERIFGLFQTLKSRDDVEGSGLGLALLRKSIESLGGNISVQSDPECGRGTEFVVRWPVGVCGDPVRAA